MSDPFRPNNNSQLVREAQFAFVLIVTLLCVLVYVAFHRVSGRKFHFRQISQTAPLARHIDGTDYPARAILDHDEHVTQKTLPTTRSSPRPNGANPRSQATRSGSTETFSPHNQPSAPAIQTLPVTTTDIMDSPPVVATPTIAQAQFIEPPKSKPAFDSAPLKHLVTSKPAVEKPAVDDPFEKIKTNESWSNPVQSLAPTHNDKETDQNLDSAHSKPPATDDLASDFRPPPIRSNFGAGSIRELPSFDTPLKKEPIEETKNPNPTPLHHKSTPTQVSSFVPPPKVVPTFARSFTSPKKPEANVVKKQIPKPKPPAIGPQEYRVQTTDSLWSIAADHYGDGRFFRALHEHNLDRIASADRLEPNTQIVIPKLDDLMKRYPELCPADKLSGNSISSGGDTSKADYDLYEKSMDKRFHITQNGDTLFDVARQRLGQASRYLEIFELNEFRIPQHANHLTPLDPGLRLLLPE